MCTTTRDCGRLLGFVLLTLPCVAGADSLAAAELSGLDVAPAAISLEGPESALQVVVTGTRTTGRAVDVTTTATFVVQDPAIVVVDEHGRLTPKRDGRTELSVTVEGIERRVPVLVTSLARPAPISFESDVQPILTKAGCNSGGCHGKAEGQNGFKLSLFGFDSVADHAAIVQQGRGRRVSLALPERSLLLAKASSRVPHGGGRALDETSMGYARLLRWVREGAMPEVDGAFLAERIEVQPAERTLEFKASQQLRVVAIDAAGHRRDVTAEAQYESNAPTIVDVDPRGLTQGGDVPGEAAVLARYMGHVAVARFRLPRPNVRFPRPPETNFVDGHVWDKLQQMGIPPSGLCDDATFLRRAYLDVIGTLPTPTEARRFLDSDDADKRARLVDELLERDEYADYWSLHWAELMRVDAAALGPEVAFAMSRWLERQFDRNRPFDELVHDVLVSRGDPRHLGPTGFYLAGTKPGEFASSVSQLFLGVRIECAQCHHHPFERWSQADYAAFSGFFTGVTRKRRPDGTNAIVAGPARSVKHPRTGEVVAMAGLGGEPVEMGDAFGTDPRVELADWMTSRENPFFARALANRLWAHYFGRGIVDPVDDMRATNPPTNPALLEALADHLHEVDFDLKAFTRTLLASRTYQLSSETRPDNVQDTQHFSHAEYRSLPAEVALDAICQVTGVPEKFNGWPVGPRAIETWDNRMPSYFFRIFGRPTRTTVCACERGDNPSITQALHLSNSPELSEKIRHPRGFARRLADSDATAEAIVDELFLATLSRPPTEAERRLFVDTYHEEDVDRRTIVEDFLWALINSREFAFNH